MKPNIKGEKMDTFLRPKGLKVIDAEIERLATTLSETEPTNESYKKIAESLRVLCEAREKKNDRVLSAEALANIVANIVGILLVLNFEKTGIITSKAISFLWKGKS
jgi:hypothetical protein